jgi:hypothetical protein
MVGGLLATVIITVFALIYWPSVKEPARQTLGNCVPGAIKGKLDADGCGQPVAAAPPAAVGTGGSALPAATAHPPSPTPPSPPAAPPRLVGSQYCGNVAPNAAKCGVEGASDPAGLEVSWSFSPLTTCDLTGFTIRTLPGGGVEWNGPSGTASYCDLIVQACNSAGSCTPMAFKHWGMP